MLGRFYMKWVCYNGRTILKSVVLLREMLGCLLSPYYIEAMLKDNQGIILANNKISHGRKKFEDNEMKREMIRGLFVYSLRNVSANE